MENMDLLRQTVSALAETERNYGCGSEEHNEMLDDLQWSVDDAVGGYICPSGREAIDGPGVSMELALTNFLDSGTKPVGNDLIDLQSIAAIYGIDEKLFDS